MHNHIILIIEADHVSTVLECLQLGKETYLINGLPLDADRANTYIEAIQSERRYQDKLRHLVANNYTRDF